MPINRVIYKKITVEQNIKMAVLVNRPSPMGVMGTGF